MNGVWRRLTAFRIRKKHDTAFVSITENVTEMAKAIGLDDAEGGDANRLLEVMAQRKIKSYTIFST
jgi:hypothetical protein